MNSLRHIFSRLDTLWLIGGLIGAALFVGLLPRLHPDAAVSEGFISEDEAIAHAISYVESLGYQTSDFTWRAFVKRESDILDTLNTRLGTRELYANLKGDSTRHLPTYHWWVEGKTGRAPEDDRSFLEVRLSKDGSAWEFSSRNISRPPANDAGAIQYTVDRLPDSLTFVKDIPLDSLLQKRWFFFIPPSNEPVRGRPPPVMPPPRDSQSVMLSRQDAATVARYHLDNTLLAGYPLEVDSIYRPSGFERNQASVLFSGQLSPGVPFHAQVDVTASGVLSRISSTYKENLALQNDSDESSFSFDFSIDALPGYLKLIGTIVLVIFALVLFIRRLSARLIDVKSALQDAIWGALFAGCLVANQAGWDIVQETDTIWSGLLIAGLTTLVTASLASFVIFMLSCGADSVARFVWPEKLNTLSMSRNLQFRNIPSGRAFIHGLSAAGVLLGIQTLILLILDAPLSYTNTLPPERGFSPLASIVSISGVYGMVYGLLVMLGVGALIFIKWRNRWVAIAGLTITFMVLQISPLGFESAYLRWVISAILGFVLAITLFRFDYFTAFLALFVFHIAWMLSPGWLLPAAGFLTDAWIGAGLLFGCVAFGIIGLVSRKELPESDPFTPSYLTEIAQQERLKSELDIATQVQSSLLPHTMPEMPGLDIAAMCLPAQEVGGDYFDFIRLDEHRLALIVGDVSGKGIQAAFYMTLTKGFIHAICREEESPAKVLTRVNDLFCQNAPRGIFISLIYGVFDTRKNTFSFARAGHDPVIFRPDMEQLEFLKPMGLAIGLTPEHTFETCIEDQTIDLTAGDLIVFYTDGVTEAVNPNKEQFGTDRLAQMVQEVGSMRASMILQNLSQKLQLFVKATSRHDDMTLMVVRCATPEVNKRPSLIDTSAHPAPQMHE